MPTMEKPKTTDERLEEVRKSKADLEFWMENGGPDSRSSLDIQRLNQLIQQEDELSRKREQELREPPQPKEAEGFWSRLMRR